MLSVTNRFSLRKAACRVLSTAPISLTTRTRSIAVFAPVHLRLQPCRSALPPLQRRWASEDSTQSEPEAPAYAENESASLADSAKSTASAVADKVSDAASQVGAAASSAVGAASGSQATQNSVYVGNLFFDVKEHHLSKEFSKAGNVIGAKVIHDHRGLSKG